VAGVGKSRLVLAFRERLQDLDWNVFQAPCLSHTRAKPYSVWISLLKGVFGIEHSEDSRARSEKVADRLRSDGIRVEVDTSDDRMQKKIRNAQRAKVPFMLLAGDTDVEAGAVSFRFRDGTQRNGVPVDEAVAHIVRTVAERA
jgi:threonyl-tRNA synthetase